jgi:hypothetical protein
VSRSANGVAVAVSVSVGELVTVPVTVGVPDGPAVDVLVPVVVGVAVPHPAVLPANALVPTAVFWVTAGAVMFAVFVKSGVNAHVAVVPTNCVIVIVPVAPEAMLPPAQTISGLSGD